MLRPMLTQLVERVRGRQTQSEPTAEDSAPAPADMTGAYDSRHAGLDAFVKVLPGQVAQIEEIGVQHRKIAEQAIWKCVSQGFDMHTLSITLAKDCELTLQTASTIAVQQCKIAKIIMENARRQDLGITHAIWMYSGAGRKPCKHHRVLNGKKYEIAQGASLSGKRVWPGIDPECMCMSRSVIPGFED